MISTRTYVLRLIGCSALFMVFWSVSGRSIADGQFNYHAPSNDYFDDWEFDYLSPKIDSPEIELTYPLEDPVDPTQDANNLIDFQDPTNINENIEYDTESGNYIFNQTIDGKFNYRPPTFMTNEEYLEFDMEKSLQEYWQSKVSEDNEKAANGGSLIPSLKVGGDKFQDIFGSNKIDIRPQGSAELKFGVNVSRTDNPQLPEKQRRISTFDFDQQIQLNVTGQIGEKLKLQTSYNTEATFDFENQVKLEYTGFEDEIIKKIEAGHVSLPLPGSLIQGASSLFGIKTELQFGRLRATSIFSQQKGERKEISVTGGAQVSEFEVPIDQYEANKHFFLNYYHRDHYDNAMAELPLVNSGVQITRVEVWVTNRTNDFTDTRNILAFTDLGERDSLEYSTGYGAGTVSDPLPRNESNGLYNYLAGNPTIRSFTNSSSALSAGTYPMESSVHYEKLENARKLDPQEYTYNAQLGFISLNQALNNDEVLAVAYQYTYLGDTYQVGEFSTDGITGTDALYLKLLKATVINPKRMLWDLMMKNVYSLGAYQVSAQNFRLDVWYNNPATSVEINYLPIAGVDNKPLVQVVGMDRLNAQQKLVRDGVFDFIPINVVNGKIENGGTINQRNGRVYFTKVEPFGAALNEELEQLGVSPQVRSGVVYQPLYDSTRVAAQQIPELNRYKLKGTYESSSGSEIPLNAFNIPRGSVQVKAGGRVLTEGNDYTVDYNLGRVRILDESVLSSGVPINISLESNSFFSIQSKTLLGTHFDYRVNKDINIGATIMNLTERPLTQKVSIGDEPISNTIFGIDGNYRKDLPILTKLVDKIPFINTKAPSNISFTGEAAYLLPGTNRAIGKGGTSYIDDFEGSQSAIDIRAFNSWTLASVPQGQPDLFPEAGFVDDLRSGVNRAKMAWYVVDNSVFYRDNNLTPSHISGNDAIQHNHLQREVLIQEIFPKKEFGTGQPANLAMFDVAYYPNERGPYNFDRGTYAAGIGDNGLLNDPETRWGGIMRSLTTNNFEAANIEYIQFWVMDPFADTEMNSLGQPASNEDSQNTTGGDLYFNLGNVSEDILRDGAKSFENGLTTNGSFDTTMLRATTWGRVPTTQVIVNAFDNDLNARAFQDVGLDGLSDANERAFYSDFVTWVQNGGANGTMSQATINAILADVSADNYNYYRDDDYDNQQADILTRYKQYNGMEGNSPTTNQSAQQNADGYPTSATTLPNIEDINRDNNLNETEAYFQYKISLRPRDMVVGQNNITDVIEAVDADSPTQKRVKWYQFRIPISSPDKAINGIQDFRSIRFMRMFLKDFDQPIVMRFASLELIRGEWRRYNRDLVTPGNYIQGEESNTTFNIGAVNIEQNTDYVEPPGIQRELNVQTQNLARLNEQSMVLEVCGLQDGDARAAFRNAPFDVLSYKKLRMFIHAASLDPMNPVGNDDVTCFVRLGTDFESNYYEYEIPLKVSPLNNNAATSVWPESNNMVIEFEQLKKAKLARPASLPLGVPYEIQDPTNSSRKIKVVGNPNLQGIKTIMIGVRNPWKDNPNNQWQPDDGLEKCVEVWVNELRLTDFDNFGGWAATARMNAQLADFATVSLAGAMSTPGFGSIDKRISERQRETIKSYDGSATVQLGKFFKEKWRVQLPLYVAQSEQIVDPMFDPLQPDIEMRDLPASDLKERRKIARDYTKRKSINFANVRIDSKKEGTKPHFWDVGNFTTSFSYNEIYHRNINLQYDTRKNYAASFVYAYNPNPKPWKPFDKVKAFRKSKWLRPIKDFNLFLKPKSIGFRTNVDRAYSESEIRANYGALTTPQYFKTFNWTRAYNMKYDLTKALKVDFNANNNAIIEENIGRVNRKWAQSEYENFRDTVRQSIRNWGTTTNYTHNINVSYQLPLNKIPLTDWVNVTTRYSVSYDWLRAPFSQPNLGNTIQNNRTVNWTGQMNMKKLYNKIPYFKKVNQKYGKSGKGRNKRFQAKKPQVNDQTEKKEDGEEKKKNEKDEKKFNILEQMARVVMMLKNINLTFGTTDGILLPGYKPTTNAFGFSPWDGDPNTISAPGWQFALGGYQRYNLFGDESGNDFATFAARQQWLLTDSLSQRLNTQFTTNHRKTINGKATIEPLGGVRIDLTFDRNESINTTSNFRDTSMFGQPPSYAYQNPVETGTFSTTIIAWRTAFEGGDSTNSKIFNNLRGNRALVSELLSQGNDSVSGLEPENMTYYNGYGEGQQDVILGAFLTAYTGKNPNKRNINPFGGIPLPNWRITIDRLTQLAFIKKIFKRLTFSHSYRSSFTVGGFTTNLTAREDGDGNLYARDANGNIISKRQITTASITEQFAPLLGFEAEMNNSLIIKLEYKKDRNISLSLSNNQVTEIKGNEIVIGSGYRFDQVELPFKIGKKKPVSDLNVRADVSIRSNKTITRKIIENQNQVTSGQRLVSIKCSADYKLGKALTIRAYFDRVMTNPFISTSFPTANTNAGMALRFTLQ